MRYKTLAELYAAYMAGKIMAPMVIDNDSVAVTAIEGDQWVDVFEMHPEEAFKQAMAILQIPTRPV